MKLPTKLQLAAIGFLLFIAYAPAAASESKNVLIFFFDDLRPELKCYGQEHTY